MATGKSLASLIDELAEDLNETIYTSVFIASDAAIEMSPVDTSRFKNAWRIGIDNYAAEESSDLYDMSGGAAQSIIEDQVSDFSILENETITLYNNVLDADNNINYAQTVSYDFTGGVAYDVISTAEQLLYSGIN